jgi:hypothetical protein
LNFKIYFMGMIRAELDLINTIDLAMVRRKLIDE